jgi:hypothetical protein
MFQDSEILFSYSRAQAIADGALIDITELAKPFGFRFSVAITSGLYAELTAGCGDDAAEQQSRLNVLLVTLRAEIAQTGSHSDRADLLISHPKAPVAAYALCGPGDTAEPVITVMLPHED